MGGSSGESWTSETGTRPRAVVSRRTYCIHGVKVCFCDGASEQLLMSVCKVHTANAVGTMGSSFPV